MQRRGDGQQSQQQQGQLQAVVQDQSGDNSNGHAVSSMLYKLPTSISSPRILYQGTDISFLLLSAGSGISAVNEGIALGASNLPPRVSPTPSDDHSPRHAAVNTPLIAPSASVSAAAVGVNASLPHGVHDQRHSSHGLDTQPLRVGAGTNLSKRSQKYKFKLFILALTCMFSLSNVQRQSRFSRPLSIHPKHQHLRCQRPLN